MGEDGLGYWDNGLLDCVQGNENSMTIGSHLNSIHVVDLINNISLEYFRPWKELSKWYEIYKALGPRRGIAF